MDRGLLMGAAIAASFVISSLPAQAQQSGSDWRHHERRNVFVETCPGSGDRRCGDRGDGFAYADGSWALFNNRSWGPESFNDWWNDRPDRAYPRWVQEQHRRGTCDPSRMWWSGAGWHC